MKEMNLLSIIEDLLALPDENEVVEFKKAENRFSNDDLGKYFSALSNEANLKNKDCAWILFGIEDKTKEVRGTNYRQGTLQTIKHDISQQTTNNHSFIDVHEVQYKGKRIVAFQIPPAPKGLPIAFKGHYYAREHESLVALNISKLEQIRSQVIMFDWSAEICPDATIDDLDPVAILKARQNYTDKHKHLEAEISNWDDSTFLNKAKLTKSIKITRAAILLLGKPESEHFISPAVAKISWILKDSKNIEKDYEHFSCPFLLASDAVFSKIRNLKYRYIKDGTIFPDETDQYDPYIIRESLNNCIAHQDYQLCGKINVVEFEDGRLLFTNLGSFIPGTIENVINSDAPTEYYRNPFLANAMVNLKMIDTIGSGIKRMFNLQREKMFPLPDYRIEESRVSVEILGKVLDFDYARTLSENHDLSLFEIIMLDKVQKGRKLIDFEIKALKSKKLIEGRKPNFYISKKVALTTGQEVNYIKQKGLDKDYYKQLILNYLESFIEASRKDFEELLFEKLPDILTENQKRSKIKNILYEMHTKDETIKYIGSGNNSLWKLRRN